MRRTLSWQARLRQAAQALQPAEAILGAALAKLNATFAKVAAAAS
ncbi:MAG TPA: hypothetical protein VKM72_19670 [Thermoanaerobaculia bacterium]|nr:hypothetical protein [Thermoanaerobaculia bacterium]